MRFANPLFGTWADDGDLMEWAQRMQRRLLRSGAAASGPVWQPPVDVFEEADGLAVIVALPGVSERQVELHVDTGSLSVVAWRALPASGGGSVSRLEIPYGRFERRIPLPPGVYEIRHHSLVDGCLRLKLRRVG